MIYLDKITKTKEYVAMNRSFAKRTNKFQNTNITEIVKDKVDFDKVKEDGKTLSKEEYLKFLDYFSKQKPPLKITNRDLVKFGFNVKTEKTILETDFDLRLAIRIDFSGRVGKLSEGEKALQTSYFKNRLYNNKKNKTEINYDFSKNTLTRALQGFSSFKEYENDLSNFLNSIGISQERLPELNKEDLIDILYMVSKKNKDCKLVNVSKKEKFLKELALSKGKEVKTSFLSIGVNKEVAGYAVSNMQKYGTIAFPYNSKEAKLLEGDPVVIELQKLNSRLNVHHKHMVSYRFRGNIEDLNSSKNLVLMLKEPHDALHSKSMEVSPDGNTNIVEGPRGSMLYFGPLPEMQIVDEKSHLEQKKKRPRVKKTLNPIGRN